jgi:hypothetical protein
MTTSTSDQQGSGQLSHAHQHHNNGSAHLQGEEGQAGRRMSDPVRPLDRNYGLGGQLSRHRSYSNLQGGGGRMPLHQQRVRGQESTPAPAQGTNPAFMGGGDPSLMTQAQQQVFLTYSSALCSVKGTVVHCACSVQCTVLHCVVYSVLKCTV